MFLPDLRKLFSAQHNPTTYEYTCESHFSLKNIFVRFSQDGTLTGLRKVTNIKCHDNPSSAQRGQTLSQQSILETMRMCIKYTVYLCVLYGFENKERLFHYTALIGWFSTARRTVSLQSISSSQQSAAASTPSAMLDACQQ